ncbi:hypothetical protein DKM19_12025 [Streptosporangium sp. 'caverna']|nr:hypothetical protein DKM19_12025 [Streptosporangium sp. 'caverna']
MKPSARSAFARRTSGRAAKGAPGRPSKDQAGRGDGAEDRTGREGEDGAETGDRFEGVVGDGAESGIEDGVEGAAGTESAAGSGSGGGAGEGPGDGAGTQVRAEIEPGPASRKTRALWVPTPGAVSRIGCANASPSLNGSPGLTMV